MCAHNSMTKTTAELAARYGRKSDLIDAVRELVEEQYRISVFTWPRCPVVTGDEEIQLYHWGLVPHWVKSTEDAGKIRFKTFNARADTLFEKPSYREPARSRRCLIPSTGFFEWRHEDGRKIPYYVYVKDEPVFSLAGVYDWWRNPETGEWVPSFSMVTTPANPLLAYIHNSAERMPAVLSREDEARWLDPEATRKDLESLLKPFDERRMDAYPVRNDFLRKSPADPSILQRAS